MRSLTDWPGPALVLIRLTDDVLEVTLGRRRGQVLPVNNATLGPWTSSRGRLVGAALHLQNVGQRFVLGDQRHRVPMGTRLGAKPIWNANAWIRAGDFDELLRAVYR
jgi:hypothetical protein